MVEGIQLWWNKDHRLVPHPSAPPKWVSAVDVEWCAQDGNEALLIYTVHTSGELALPPPATPRRTDGLWRTTCFEMFVGLENQALYYEVNLSPSNCWAVYAFDEYRGTPSQHAMAIEPHIEVREEADRFIFEADVDFSTFPNRPSAIGLSAVIEEADGTLSYWALAHPPGLPDFHHPSCFLLDLPAAV